MSAGGRVYKWEEHLAINAASKSIWAFFFALFVALYYESLFMFFVSFVAGEVIGVLFEILVFTDWKSKPYPKYDIKVPKFLDCSGRGYERLIGKHSSIVFRR